MQEALFFLIYLHFCYNKETGHSQTFLKTDENRSPSKPIFSTNLSIDPASWAQNRHNISSQNFTIRIVKQMMMVQGLVAHWTND